MKNVTAFSLQERSNFASENTGNSVSNSRRRRRAERRGVGRSDTALSAQNLALKFGFRGNNVSRKAALPVLPFMKPSIHSLAATQALLGDAVIKIQSPETIQPPATPSSRRASSQDSRAQTTSDIGGNALLANRWGGHSEQTELRVSGRENSGDSLLVNRWGGRSEQTELPANSRLPSRGRTTNTSSAVLKVPSRKLSPSPVRDSKNVDDSSSPDLKSASLSELKEMAKKGEPASWVTPISKDRMKALQQSPMLGKAPLKEG